MRAALLAVAAVVVFALGVGLGEALHDNPAPGGTQTSIRTLHPVQLAPQRITVTVTTTR